ncbi:MAG: CBS domain-containing protein [Spirochaetales bacterium]|nr:MAG: CBS domain-containing protein [Spirochaetales bacterium]
MSRGIVVGKDSVDKLQMLVYELDVESAMTKDVVSVGPDLPVESLREVLRSKRISGVPVTDGDRLLGIVSVEDYIKWLADDGRPRRIADIMTRKVQTVYSDEPLVHVVSRLEGHGYGRLPVLDRKSGGLVGLITKGDVIQSLLVNLKIDFQEEEIRNYRTTRFFEEIIATLPN